MSLYQELFVAFYLFMLLCVVTNKEMSIKSFSTQLLMVAMSGVGMLLFFLVDWVNKLVGGL
jgi:hypothetical protein